MLSNPADFVVSSPGYVGVPFVAIPQTGSAIKSHTWAWGDGTVSLTPSASHIYTEPGIYQIQHIACSYSGIIHTVTQNVSAIALVQDHIEMAWDDPTIFAGIAATVTFTVTSRELPQGIQLHYDNSSSTYPKSIQQRNPLHFWDHLVPKWAFVAVDDTSLVSAITVSPVTSEPITVNGYTIGYTSIGRVNFIDQKSCDVGTVWATVKYEDYTNSRVYAASSIRVSAIDPNSTNTTGHITSDGLIPWVGQQIVGIPFPVIFVVKDNRLSGDQILHHTYTNTSVTYTQWFDGVDEQSQVLSAFGTSIICDVTALNERNLYTPQYVHEDGLVRKRVELSCSAGVVNIDGRYDFAIVENTEAYRLRKFNEAADLADIFAHYAPGHIVERAPIFFDTYLRAIFGDPTLGNDQDPGIKIYERIANFVSNHGDVDTCGIKQLISNAEMTGTPINRLAVSMPADFERIVDIVSVPFDRVIPTNCACNRTFTNCDTCCDNGLTCKLCKLSKTSNRGNAIDCATYTVTAGTPIVYQDNITLATNLLHTVPVSGVSAYNVTEIDYGGMIQPICTNYTLYEYISTPAGNPIESIINWTDDNTLVSPEMTYDDWVKRDGIVERMLMFHLIRGLQVT